MRITEITPAQAVTIAGGPTLCTPGEAATAVADMLQDPTVAQGHRLADAVAHVQHAVREACPWWDTIQAPEGASAWSDQEAELQAAEAVLHLAQEHGVRHQVQVPAGWAPCSCDEEDQADPFLAMMQALAASLEEADQADEQPEQGDNRP